MVQHGRIAYRSDMSLEKALRVATVCCAAAAVLARLHRVGARDAVGRTVVGTIRVGESRR
jgi:hypothetical protein